jgi:hypothetical protein
MVNIGKLADHLYDHGLLDPFRDAGKVGNSRLRTAMSTTLREHPFEEINRVSLGDLIAVRQTYEGQGKIVFLDDPCRPEYRII